MNRHRFTPLVLLAFAWLVGCSSGTIIKVDPVEVNVTPGAVNLGFGQEQRFSATVTGSSNQQVTWSVEGTNAGSISTEGVYTAPSVAGLKIVFDGW